MKFLLNDDNANWKVLPKSIFGKIGTDRLFLYMNLQTNKYLPIHISIFSQFYLDIIKTWLTYKTSFTRKPQSYVDIRNQLIWGNSYIRFKKKTLFFKAWVKSGNVYVNDIINHNRMVDHNIILRNLVDKSNWIAQYAKLKKNITDRVAE